MKKLLFIGLLLFSSPAFATNEASKKCAATYVAVINLVRIGAPYEVIMLEHQHGFHSISKTTFQNIVWEVYSSVGHYASHVDKLHEDMKYLEMVASMTEACENDWRVAFPFE